MNELIARMRSRLAELKHRAAELNTLIKADAYRVLLLVDPNDNADDLSRMDVAEAGELMRRLTANVEELRAKKRDIADLNRQLG